MGAYDAGDTAYQLVFIMVILTGEIHFPRGEILKMPTQLICVTFCPESNDVAFGRLRLQMVFRVIVLNQEKESVSKYVKK